MIRVVGVIIRFEDEVIQRCDDVSEQFMKKYRWQEDRKTDMSLGLCNLIPCILRRVLFPLVFGLFC